LDKRRVRPWLTSLAAVPVLLCFFSAAQAAALPTKLEQLRVKAEECEKKGQWLDACACYDQILKIDRAQPEVRERFYLCLRHVQQLRRHQDPSLKTILNRPLTDALDIYEEVLVRLQMHFVERDKIQVSSLFLSGLQELRFALEDDSFLLEHLDGISPDKVRAFAMRLDQWPDHEIRQVRDARDQLRSVALAALDELQLSPAVVVMEFAFGAAHALDEYTTLLTPGQLSYVQAALHGEIVGIGIKVAVADQKLFILSVVPNSPAGEKGLKPNDRITRIDGQPTENWSEEMAGARLQGKAGSSVEIELLSVGEMTPHSVKLMRQPVQVPSVEWEAVPREGVGYIHVLTFQDTTVQELKDVILQLQTAQMKALVLDLRGNPGGSFKAAVQIAEMFLPDGVITFTESPLKKFKTTYRAHNPNALTFPLVVLVDGETASAAEVVAGALKENQRATLVGTTTFGKGSIQCPVPLDKVPAGIWITVAKFFSPNNQPYHGRGVTPHIIVELDVMGAQRTAAWQAAVQLAMMAR
jgi:carboxyl-terminal processing protease